MRGHVGAVLTSGLAALAMAFMVLFTVVTTRPAIPSAFQAGNPRTVPWTPTPKAEPSHRDVKPREPHRAPPRNRGGFFPDGPRAPRRAAA